MKNFLPFLLAFMCWQCTAQNHVPNGSFESYSTCPYTLGQTDRCTGWSQYHLGSSDYYNACGTAGVNVPVTWGGYQQAAHGDAFMGVITHASGNNYKEYITRQITPLQPGTLYEVSLSVNIPNNAGWVCNDLGVLFYDNMPPGGSSAPCITVPPQVSYTSYGVLSDTTNWLRLTGRFIADSAYDNIIIGGFTPFGTLTVTPTNNGVGGISLYAYYFIDSVVVRPLMSFSVDTLFCAGDTVNIPYTVAPSYYATGNVFTVQLSNALGGFSAPTNIGSVASASSGMIQAVLPAGATGIGYRMRLTSTLPTDTSGNNGQNIRIKPKPVPVATSNSPICAGSTLSLGASAAAGASFSWAGPSSFSSVLANPTVTGAATTHSGDYIVTATLNGCSGKDTVAALVKTLPAAPTAGNNGPVCMGSPLSLTAASSTAGVSYSWNGPSGYSAGTQNPTIASTILANAGVYNVTASLNGCTSAPGSTSVQVKPMPAVPTATSNSPICAGGMLNLFATSTTPGVNYSWTGPPGFTSGTQNPVISPAPLNAAGAYSVTAELNGCTSAAGSVTVVVNNVSSLGVYPSPNDTLCANNASASFTAVPFNAGAAPQYQWYKNNNLISGAASISYPATGIADGDSFYCRMTVTGLCADPQVLYSNKVGMTVLPNVGGPSVTITADPGTLLSPWQLVKFTAVATNAGALPKYQWKRNGQDVLGANSNVWSANNLSNSDTIHCVVTSDVWCALPASEVSNRMVVNIKTGITDIDADRKLELYPNPNNGTFSLLPASSQGRGDILIEVVDALGRTVYKVTNQLVNQSTIDITLPSSVANGVYMLKLNTGDKIYHVRFMVNR